MLPRQTKAAGAGRSMREVEEAVKERNVRSASPLRCDPSVISRAVLDGLGRRSRRSSRAGTETEHEVALLLLKGMSSKEIAQAFFLEDLR